MNAQPVEDIEVDLDPFTVARSEFFTVRQKLADIFRRLRPDDPYEIDPYEIEQNLPELEAEVESVLAGAQSVDPVSAALLRARLRRLREACVRLRMREGLFEEEDCPAFCAELYRRLDPARHPSKAAFREVRQLPPLGRGEKPGLLLYGPTGSGKTFLAWHAARRWLASKPADLRLVLDIESDEIKYPAFAYAFTAPGLKALATSMALRDPAAATTWKGAMGSRGLILVDDLSQVKLTSAFAERLFELVERVVSARRPFVATMQMPAANLLSKWRADDPGSAEAALAIVRRLADHCHVVKVEKDPPVIGGELTQ